MKKIVRRRKRVGRGIGSKGAKSGRGMKGQKARAGYRRRSGFEGGQTPLYQRLPKGRGAKRRTAPHGPRRVATVTIAQLARLTGEVVVGPGVLRKAGFVRRRSEKVKLIGSGDVGRKLTVRVHGVSAAARQAVERAGGTVELISASAR